MGSKNKQIGKNQPTPSRGSTVQQSHKLIATASQIQPVLQAHIPGEMSPQWSEQQFTELSAAISEDKRPLLGGLIEQMAAFGKALREVSDSLERQRSEVTSRDEKLSEDEEALTDRNEAIKKGAEELLMRQDGILKKESQFADKERELEKRELDARTGFAAQNVAALGELKKEIAELESRRITVQIGIHQADQKARDDEAERSAKLMEQEAEVAIKERALLQAQRRLDAEWKDLERERTQIKEESQRDSAQEIARLTDARQRTDDRLEKVYRDWTLTEQKMEQYREFSDALAGRPARELIDELASHRRQIALLENQISTSQDDHLKSENESLRKIRDEQRTQLDEVHTGWANDKAQLHRLRLGVSDKESLEREKRALEKNNQILAARLNDLGKTVDDLTQSQQSDKPFPQMGWMDTASNADWIKERKAKELSLPEQDVPDLKKFSLELQHRIAQAEDGTPLYFGLEDIQLLIGGLAMSQLHIFQGISGTGKTSLAKAFAKAVGGHCTDIAVQAGWRDRDDLLGHYNAFEKRFYERDCLQGLYRAQTSAYKDRCNIILLDEMNLSRPEQYFAEFLSALEKNDPRERLISLSESQLPNAPTLLVEGRRIRVPHNVWFVGTANHDETTNEFADKTYDRAHVMTLPRHEAGFKIEPKPKASYSYIALMERFDVAVTQNAAEVEELLTEMTTGPLTKVLQDQFDLGWGNRFERQAKRFVPVFMAAGGRKEDALDHLLASRVFRRGKVTGRYDATIENLTAIEQALTTVWKGWKSSPHRSLGLLAEDRCRKERGA